MTYPITDDFSDLRGRWDAIAPWDVTEEFNASVAELATQEHVDLRCFLSVGNLVAVPQTDLEAVQQSVLDAEPQTSLEEKLGINTLDELWALTTTTGTNNNLAVGKIAARGGWSGAQFTVDGTALAADLDSVIATSIDISTEDFLSIVFPDHNSFTEATSYIQLTSSPLGFGHGADSAQVAFSANADVMPHLKLSIASFANAGFDNTKVYGIRIHLVEAAPTVGATVTVLAIRAIKSSWVVSGLDFNTRLGGLVAPVTLNGNIYAGSVISGFEFVRGDLSKQDPIPADVVINIFFAPGGGTSPNDATGAVHNEVGLIFREIKDTGAGTGSHIRATLKFNDAETLFEAKRVDTTGGSPGVQTTHGLYTETVGGVLDPLKNYNLQVEIRGTQIFATLYETDINKNTLSTVWHLATTLSDSNYTYRQGRVGFVGTLVSRDAYIDELLVSPTGFASMTTQVFNTRTPVDGGQLTAVSSEDENLWSGFTGSDIFIDNSLTVSGFGSFRTAIGLTSNTFIVDDWTNTYLSIALWVPTNVTTSNQPQVVLNTPSATENLVMPKLQPGQWNSLYFDLGVFCDLVTGIGYSFSVLAASTPDKALGNFWADSVTLGRRRVAWSMRATANGPWRYFKDMLNNPTGAVHLPHDERGALVQLRAEALTEDAWVSSFKLIPHYAELGLPLWDQAFDSV